MINKSKKIFIEENDRLFDFKQNYSNTSIIHNRLALLFFLLVFVMSLYSLKLIFFAGMKVSQAQNTILKNENYRADIIDRNGILIAKTVPVINVRINPSLLKDKKKLIIKLKLIFPNKDYVLVEKKINRGNSFYFEKKISNENFEKVRKIGDKSISFEKKITRIYPQKELFSHIIGQIDSDNIGISGIEKFYDEELKTLKKPLKLSVDTNLQYLIRNELIKASHFFKNVGSSSILMDVDSGEILSMISLPDYDINKRANLKEKVFINRSTKGIYELGSVFKTITIASALNAGVVDTDTKFINLEKKIFCGGRPIREYDEKIPSNLTTTDILVRSGNIGSIRIAQKIGIKKHELFLKELGLLDKIEFDLEEVGAPLELDWGKCKLATVAFGHGITTTPLQLAKAYSIISNGGYDVSPKLALKIKDNKFPKKRILKKGISKKINNILREVVVSENGTAGLADVEGYEVGGKTGTAQQVLDGNYSNLKINTFVSVFPSSKPKYVLLVLLEAPKTSKDYIYKFRNKPGTLKGTPFNTAGWTSVEITGKIIENIGPILATKYLDHL